MRAVALVVLAALIGGPRGALAQPPRAQPSRAGQIIIEIPAERSTQTKLLLGGTALVGVVFTALGVYWNLDARDAASEVEARTFTGMTWTRERADLVMRADRSSIHAAFGYSIGGGFAISAIVMFLLSDPKSSRRVIRARSVHSGLVLGGEWRF
ncbi:MAG: hypothetical protein WKG01_17585 [Kofleriaceae bacterium]